MQKKILVFSNGEKIGDGLIKLPLLNEIKRRLPEYKIVWMTNRGRTVYNNQLKNIANQFIDEIIEQADLNTFFLKKISNKYDFSDKSFEYIFDTQKTVLRTIALKRIKCSFFISAAASGLFSTIKLQKKYQQNTRQYYLEDLFDLLNLIKTDQVDRNFKIALPQTLEIKLGSLFNKNYSYIGFAPGAGEKDKIWPLDNFIEVAKYFEKKSHKIVFFLGPQEQMIKNKLISIFPNSFLPEDQIDEFSGPEIVMATTKFLSCALTNDSGISHMLSTNYCPLIKLFGPKDSDKFTPKNYNITNITAKEFGSNNVESIPLDYVINKINNILNFVSDIR